MMRIAMGGLLWAAVLATAQASDRGPAGAAAQVRQADEALQAAIERKDLDAIVAFYADDAQLLPTAEPMMAGRAAIRDEWEHILAIPDFQSRAKLLQVEVAGSGDFAYTLGTYVARMQGEDGQPVSEPGKWVSIWKRQADGAWRIVVDTYNTDVPPPDHK